MMHQSILRDSDAVRKSLLQALDLVAIGACAFAAGMLYVEPDKFFTARYYLIILIGLCFFWVGLNKTGCYDTLKNLSIEAELKSLLKAWILVVIALSVFFFMTRTGARFSRVWAGLWFSMSFMLVFSMRFAARHGLAWLRMHGDLNNRVFLIGRPTSLQSLEARLQLVPNLGVDVVGRYEIVDGVMLEPEWQTLFARVSENHVDQIWVSLPLRDELLVEEVLTRFALSPVEIRYFPDLLGMRLFSHSVTEVVGLPVINLSSTPMEGFNRVVKEIEDRVLSLLILLLISPLMLMLAIGVKMSSPGPVFFRQQRHGWGGKPIHVLKFRSMVVHKEADNAVTQATKNDDRVTAFGRFMRRTSLDELPQFWNVLMGEMSIVGPRPHAVAHNEQYKILLDDYMLRHRVKPGITGWAQIHGYRGETDTLDKMKMRVEYDLYYIEHWSLWLDLKIIVLTVFKGFVNKSAY